MKYYDRQGKEISQEQWIVLGADRAYRQVAHDDYGWAAVSTVWLGLDHRMDPTSPKQIFETMIFGGEYDEYQWRYSTEKEALEGHHNALKLIMPLITKEEYIHE